MGNVQTPPRSLTSSEIERATNEIIATLRRETDGIPFQIGRADEALLERQDRRSRERYGDLDRQLLAFTHATSIVTMRGLMTQDLSGHQPRLRYNPGTHVR